MEQIKETIQNKKEELLKIIWENMKRKGNFNKYPNYEDWEKRNDKNRILSKHNNI